MLAAVSRGTDCLLYRITTHASHCLSSHHSCTAARTTSPLSGVLSSAMTLLTNCALSPECRKVLKKVGAHPLTHLPTLAHTCPHSHSLTHTLTHLPTHSLTCRYTDSPLHLLILSFIALAHSLTRLLLQQAAFLDKFTSLSPKLTVSSAQTQGLSEAVLWLRLLVNLTFSSDGQQAVVKLPGRILLLCMWSSFLKVAPPTHTHRLSRKPAGSLPQT